MSESENSPRKITAKDKRRRALELRKGGLSYQRIAESPTDRAGGNHAPLYAHKGSAYKAVARALEEHQAASEETAHEVLALELARLDEMHAGVWMSAVRGDDKAIGAALRIMERRTKYLGLDFADGLDERHLAVQEQEAARTQDAFEHALRAVGMTDDQVEEVFGHAADHLRGAEGDEPPEGPPGGGDPPAAA